MDFSLKCNSLKCRSTLTDRAIVTTCSHIFCKKCSTDLGLTASPGRGRFCPACQSVLPNPDDVVSTSLNPTEDYKTSVLSGLAPSTVMECAGRALAFWSYQSTQEIVYQEYLAKTLTDKYSGLNAQMDKVISDANSELELLGQKLNHMQADHERLHNENTRLVTAFREKNRKHQQTQELYDRLKRREMTAVTQSAASQSVDNILRIGAEEKLLGHVTQDSQVQQVPHRNVDNQTEPSIDRNERSHSHQRQRSIHSLSSNDRMPPPPMRRPATYDTTNFHGVQPTPSAHRTQLGIARQSPNRRPAHHRDPAAAINRSLSNTILSQQQYTNHADPMSISRQSSRGYGMSAGIKVGGMPSSKFSPSPRVAQGNFSNSSVPRFTIDEQFRRSGN